MLRLLFLLAVPSAHTALVHAMRPAGLMARPSIQATLRRPALRMCAEADVDAEAKKKSLVQEKRATADRLALAAERAALESEQMRLEVEQMKLNREAKELAR